MATSTPIIVTQNLGKRYGDVVAVDGLDLVIYRGECFGLLGPNGAGKTTTVRMLYGLTPIIFGKIWAMGLDVTRFTRKVKSRIGVVPQEDSLDAELTVWQNLTLYAGYFSLGPAAEVRQRLEDLVRFAGLEEKAQAQVEKLSGGMKRRLALARALVNDPELLILDEPTTGLDPQARQLVWQRLRQLQEQGVTLLLTTHYMDEAAYLCDRLAIMDRGRVVAQGAPPELVAAHAGRHVLEVGAQPGEEAAVVGELAPLARDYQEIGENFFFYLDDPEAAMTALAVLAPGLRYHLLRPATLEDVFLKLTGRGLGREPEG
ncbi:MAG: ATP-binding cassette domain-containing protein [Clostridia bacterium]|nr:MAG: ATP-binding cassette domain-containing protein [Clostridia bacterium]